MGAKDIAFEKERVKYRQKVKEAERICTKRLEEVQELQLEISKTDDKIRELEEWVERLLEFNNINREEFLAKIESEKKVSTVLGILGAFGRGLRY